MSSQNPYPPTHTTTVIVQPTNTAGLVGFILSMSGIVCGITFPIGLIVSLAGIGKEPKGLAIAGTIIGALGTLMYVAIVVMYGAVIAACIGFGAAAMQPIIETETALNNAERQIEEYQFENDQLPTEAEGNQLIAELEDGWDNGLRYELTDEGEDFLIRSAGPDGEFDTLDDETTEDYDDFEIDDSEMKKFDPNVETSDVGESP